MKNTPQNKTEKTRPPKKTTWLLLLISVLFLITTTNTNAYTCTRWNPMSTECDGTNIGNTTCSGNWINLYTHEDGCDSCWDSWYSGTSYTTMAVNVTSLATGTTLTATQNYPTNISAGNSFWQYDCGTWKSYNSLLGEWNNASSGAYGDADKCVNGSVNTFNYTYNIYINNATIGNYTLWISCYNGTGWAVIINKTGLCNNSYEGIRKMSVTKTLNDWNSTLNISVNDTNHMNVTGITIRNLNSTINYTITQTPEYINHTINYSGINITWKLNKTGWYNTTFTTIRNNSNTTQNMSNTYIRFSYANGSLLDYNVPCYTDSAMTTIKHNMSNYFYTFDTGNQTIYCNTSTLPYVSNGTFNFTKLATDPANETFTFYLTSFGMTFTENTTVEVKDTTHIYKYNNTNSITINYSNFNTGEYVYVTFGYNQTWVLSGNVDSSDGIENITMYVYNLPYSKTIKVTSDNVGIENVVLKTYMSNGTNWVAVGGYLTGGLGETYIKYTDGTYKLVTHKQGYTDTTTLKTFNSGVITTEILPIEKTTSSIEEEYNYADCGAVEYESKLCSLVYRTSTAGRNITFTRIDVLSGTTTTSHTSVANENIDETFWLNIDNYDVNITVYKDGTEYYTTRFQYLTHNITNTTEYVGNITITEETKTALSENRTAIIIFNAIILIAILIIIGSLNKYVQGLGTWIGIFIMYIIAAKYYWAWMIPPTLLLIYELYKGIKDL